MTRTVLAPVDPMISIRLAAKDQIDTWFNGVAFSTIHRDQARAAKRIAAQKLLTGEATTALDAEAALRNTTPAALAAIIVAKPDELADRELHRQKAFAKIEAITDPAELEAFLSDISKV